MFAYAHSDPSADGFAIVTDRFVCLLSADASPDVISELHAAMSAPGATTDDALRAVTPAEAVARFALVEVTDPRERHVTVTVRGDVVVDLGSAATSRYTWPQGAQWVRGEAQGVESLQLSLHSVRPADAGQPLTPGLVRAVSLSVALAPEPVVIPEPVVVPEPVLTPTVPAARTPSPWNPDAFESAMRKRSGPIDVDALLEPKEWVLLLPDGNELKAVPQIVVGRRPWRSSPDETQTYFIVAPSPQREISGKHLEFTVVAGELGVRDLDSTNGTLLLRDDQPPRLLHGGESTLLAPGDVLDLGEGFRIVVGTRR